MESLEGSTGASRELSGKASPGKQIPEGKPEKQLVEGKKMERERFGRAFRHGLQGGGKEHS